MAVKVGDRALQGKDGKYGWAEVIYVAKPNREINYRRIVQIRFDITKNEKWCYSEKFLKGRVRDEFNLEACGIIKVGDRFLQGKFGQFGWAECIDAGSVINGHRLITIRFDNTGAQRSNVQAFDFRQGRVKDYYAPVVCGIGYLGDIAYKYPNCTSRFKKEYSLWTAMLERVVSDSCSAVGVSDEFCNFTIFLNWLHKQDNVAFLFKYTGMSLDKDVIKKGNLIYSADTCSIIPSYLNVCFPKTVSKKVNFSYPRGLFLNNHHICVWFGKFDSYFSIHEEFSISVYNNLENAQYYRDVALVYYNTYSIEYNYEELAAIGAAFLWRKETLEARFKELANFYYYYKNPETGEVEHLITKECYDALMTRTVEITD